MKKRTSVYIDADLLEKAKNACLNISQLLEAAIQNALNGVEAGFRVPSRRVRGFESLPPHSMYPVLRTLRYCLSCISRKAGRLSRTHFQKKPA